MTNINICWEEWICFILILGNNLQFFLELNDNFTKMEILRRKILKRMKFPFSLHYSMLKIGHVCAVIVMFCFDRCTKYFVYKIVFMYYVNVLTYNIQRIRVPNNKSMWIISVAGVVSYTIRAWWTNAHTLRVKIKTKYTKRKHFQIRFDLWK